MLGRTSARCQVASAFARVLPALWPVRAHQKRTNPEEYAANRAKYKGKKWYET